MPFKKSDLPWFIELLTLTAVVIGLSFGAIEPVEQDGFSVDHDNNGMRVEALFVGELNIEVYFDGAEG